MECPSVDAIRETFPEPLPGWKRDANEQDRTNPGYAYCAAGALLLYLRGQSLEQAPRAARFPSPPRLAACLRECNPRLSVMRSLVWAFAVTLANDHGARRPAAAWELLRRALSWPQPSSRAPVWRVLPG